MAHSLSAKKRVRQNKKRNLINKSRKGKVKAEIKLLNTALDTGDVDKATEQFRKVVKTLDKTASTSSMHKKTAARKKSQLAKKLNALKAKKT